MVYVMKAAWRFRFSAKRKVRRMERKKNIQRTLQLDHYRIVSIFVYIFIRPIIA